MSLVDEILAKHKLCDGCVTGCGRHCGACQSFRSNEWPCESVRLATKLKAAEQVVEAARKVVDTSMRALITCAFCYSVIPQHLDDCPFAELRDSLAEYDQGGQG